MTIDVGEGAPVGCRFCDLDYRDEAGSFSELVHLMQHHEETCVDAKRWAERLDRHPVE